jgi:hypothetical protein
MPTKQTPPPLEAMKRGQDAKAKENRTLNYIGEQYSAFLKMYTAYNMRLPILGGRKLLEFWNDSVRDYAVLAAEADDANDPVEAYQSTVSRDKTNALCSELQSKYFYPSVVAQNSEQSIDRTMGRVGDAALYWAFRQDGWPAESGQQKGARIIHKGAVEGTAFTLDVVTEEGLDSQLIPNEEIFFPNMWQPNIQLQSRVVRVRLNMDVGEAEEEFGAMPEWDKVDTTGGWTSAFIIQYPELKGIFDGIVQSDKVSAFYIWRRASQDELESLKKDNRVNKWAKRAWFYDVIVNNVSMFGPDNVSPYKSGFLPISKMIFEPMAKTEFAYGNSVPNKCREDKRWKDAWKTNLRWRGKLAGMPPQLVIGGHLDGEEVMLPAQFTSLPKDVDVKQVPGIVPISNTDITLMNMADEEISRSTMEETPKGAETARTAMIQQSNAKAMLAPFAQQLAFFSASRSFHILTALFQYLPKGDMKKIAVPDQTLDDGLTGTFEVVFRKPEEVLADEVDDDELKTQMADYAEAGQKPEEGDVRKLMHSAKLKADGDRSRKNGNPVDRVFVDPGYLSDLKFYLFSDAASGLQDKDAMAQANMQADMPLMLQDQTGSLVPREVWREYVKIRGYSERMLAKGEQSAMPPQASLTPQEDPGEAVSQGTAPSASGLKQPPTSPNQEANAASMAVTGKPMPNLPGV